MEQQIRFCRSSDGTRIAYATLGEGIPLVSIPPWAESLETGRLADVKGVQTWYRSRTN